MSDDVAHETEFRGYYPGVVGAITTLHAVYYHEHWGFDITFETQVGRELSEFMGRFHRDRDYFGAAVVGNRFAGAVAIDAGGASSEGARLRWFIVEPEFRGRGIGTTLIGEALAFCRTRGYRVYLWTFEGLHAARCLYEREGFRLSEEHESSPWGRRIKEQKFVRPRDPDTGTAFEAGSSPHGG